MIACKARQSNSGVKADGDDPVALDVNDVSILFEKTGNGAFYPNVPVSGVWPNTAFRDLIQFTRLHELNGVKFGQFILPKEYVQLVDQYTNNPQATPPANNPMAVAAKEIADEIQRSGTFCSPAANGTRLCIDANAQVSFNNHRDAIGDFNQWRIVSMRMDLCAGAHAGPSNDQCDVEFRLIAQPFGDFPPAPPVNGQIPALSTKPGQRGPHMFDVSAHLLYKLGTLDVQTGIIKDASGNIVGSAPDIVADLQRLKQKSPTDTNGKPLGVHPGLRTEARTGGNALGNEIKAFISKYTRNGQGMTGVTSMQLAGQTVFDSSIWVFFQGDVNGGRWSPTPITGTDNVWSIRTASIKGKGGKMFPPPDLQNRTLSIDPIFDYEQGQNLPAGVADLPAFFDNPGRYGDPQHQVNGKPAASVKNTDCVSCHMTATRAFEWNVKSQLSSNGTQPSLYTPPVGTTAYVDPEVLPRVDYNLRNFGYFLPPPFVSPLKGNEQGLGIFNFPGQRTEVGAIMPRVATESAELVNFINSRFIGAPNPGLRCKNEDVAGALGQSTGGNPFAPQAQQVIRRNPIVHAAIADCLLYQTYKPNQNFASCVASCQPQSGPVDTGEFEDVGTDSGSGHATVLKVGSYKRGLGTPFACDHTIANVQTNAAGRMTSFDLSLVAASKCVPESTPRRFTCTQVDCRWSGNGERRALQLTSSTSYILMDLDDQESGTYSATSVVVPTGGGGSSSSGSSIVLQSGRFDRVSSVFSCDHTISQVQKDSSGRMTSFVLDLVDEGSCTPDGSRRFSCSGTVCTWTSGSSSRRITLKSATAYDLFDPKTNRTGGYSK